MQTNSPNHICIDNDGVIVILSLGAAPETSGIYISKYSVCPHLRTTLLTPARMRHVLDFYHQDQEKP